MADPQQTPPDSGGLHSLAVDAQSDLHQLATGLAHAGASPQAVDTITHMGDILGEIIKVLGSPDNAQSQAPAPGPGQPPAAAPGPPAAAAPGSPPPGAPPQQHALHAATLALHAATQASAQQRRPTP